MTSITTLSPYHSNLYEPMPKVSIGSLVIDSLPTCFYFLFPKFAHFHCSIFDPLVKDSTNLTENNGMESSPSFASFHNVAIKRIGIEYGEILKVTEEMVGTIVLSTHALRDATFYFRRLAL